MPQKAAAKKNGTAPERKPSGPALQTVDRAVGAVPVVADAVRTTVGQLSKSETRDKELKQFQNQVSNLRDSDKRPAQVRTFKRSFNKSVDRAEARGADVRQQVTDRVVDEARKARQRVEPVYKQRVEPVVKQRVEPVYKQRVEPTVRRVRERI